MSAVIMYTTGAYLKPMMVKNEDGKELYVWVVTEFSDSGFLDGKDYDPIETADNLETLISNRDYDQYGTKFVMFRDFIYGLDVTEFGENEKVVLYDTRAEAEESLKEYITDVNVAYKTGDMDEPYQNDIEIREVVVYDDEGYLEDVETNKRFNLTQE